MSTATPVRTRRVRVTVEGDARPVPEVSTTLLRLDYGGRTLLIDTAHADVQVEDVAQPRTWTDGDVVATKAAVWTRHDGKWHTPDKDWTALDANVESCLAVGESEVLRYQAGGDR